VWGCGNSEGSGQVSRLSGAENVVGERGELECYVLLCC